MTGALLLVLIVPLSFAVAAIADGADEVLAWLRSHPVLVVPPPPEWVESLPLVGSRLAAAWREVMEAGSEGLLTRLSPYAGPLAAWFAAKVGGIGMVLVHFLLTVVIAAILYSQGEVAGAGVIRFARRLAGDRGENAARLAAQAIRAVAMGVVVTALAQSMLGGLGLAVAGFTGVPVLVGVMFVLGVAQMGPLPVLVPSVAWLFWKGDAGWATALLVWTLLVGAFDNVVRPILIRRGANLPFLLIFAGVVGGLIVFGIIGLFIGPVILAVTYTLLDSWIGEGHPSTPSAEGL
jgi:predicted PurR-regulated permease PerM